VQWNGEAYAVFAVDLKPVMVKYSVRL
jgi:hypothetical protein